MRWIGRFTNHHGAALAPVFFLLRQTLNDAYPFFCFCGEYQGINSATLSVKGIRTGLGRAISVLSVFIQTGLNDPFPSHPETECFCEGCKRLSFLGDKIRVCVILTTLLNSVDTEMFFWIFVYFEKALACRKMGNWGEIGNFPWNWIPRVNYPKCLRFSAFFRIGTFSRGSLQRPLPCPTLIYLFATRNSMRFVFAGKRHLFSNRPDRCQLLG